MSTNFPVSLDSYTDVIDNVDAIVASHINNPHDAVETMQVKIGVDNSVITTTIDYKIRFHNHQSGSQGGAIDLATSAVTGILPKANGGTGVTALKVNASGYAVYA